MRSLLRITKLIPFILILLIVSAGYRLFSRKESVQKKSTLFDSNTARADVPGCAGCVACAEGCAEGGGGEGGEGCSSY